MERSQEGNNGGKKLETYMILVSMIHLQALARYLQARSPAWQSVDRHRDCVSCHTHARTAVASRTMLKLLS